jgi:hypothetical protein
MLFLLKILKVEYGIVPAEERWRRILAAGLERVVVVVCSEDDERSIKFIDF